jgi:hypothetical protein
MISKGRALREGVYRRVFLIGSLAVKTPRLHQLAAGLRCNRWEREMWRVWRPKFGWPNLCPILFADRVGFFVVMPRADRPATEQEAHEALGDHYPEITSDTKPAGFGKVGYRVVVLDYGLPDAKTIRERRASYAKR